MRDIKKLPQHIEADVKTGAFLFVIETWQGKDLFSFAEIALIYAAERADEIFRQIFKFGAGLDAVVRIADFFVVFPTANVAYIFFHRWFLL